MLIPGQNSLLALETLVCLLGVVYPTCVVDRDLIAGSGRVGAIATGNDLSFDTHIEFWFCGKGFMKFSTMENEVRRGATLIRIFPSKWGSGGSGHHRFADTPSQYQIVPAISS
jgi:hypothetical protein